MLAAWEREFPGRTESISSALRHVELEHLGDARRFDFAGLESARVAAMSDGEEQALAARLAAASA